MSKSYRNYKSYDYENDHDSDYDFSDSKKNRQIFLRNQRKLRASEKFSYKDTE